MMGDRELIATIQSGNAILFTGAGFSASASDRAGRALPDGETMRRELWALMFGDGEPDDSSLPDLFDVALSRQPRALESYLDRRLRLGSSPLPASYARWFAAPWRKIYTLNVDDLALRAREQFGLRLAIRSSLRDRPTTPGELEVIHLNGLVCDGVEAITFSTLQYAARLCTRERDYEVLANDLEHYPFVFVGTTLDEVVLWQHVELRRRRSGEKNDAPASYLVARTLSRARQLLLEDLGLRWIEATIEELVDWFDR